MKDRIEPRRQILNVPPDQHGALDYAELERMGINPQDVLDFSANINPYGPPPAVLDAIRHVPVTTYPDRQALALIRALAARHAVQPAQIAAGNGAAEIIWLIAFTFLKPQDSVLILGPTFGEYQRCARLMGAQAEMITALPEKQFTIQDALIGAQLAKRQPHMVFLCNPNNPTGQALAPQTITNWAEAYPQTLFIIDEAYLPFTSGLDSLSTCGLPNVLVLRSMTKDYAIPGLRLGYAIGPQKLIDGVRRAAPSWNVNTLAQAAGTAALQDRQHFQASLKRLQDAKTDLVGGLQDLGYAPVPSQTHFFILPVGDAAQFRSRLLEKRIQVRDCASFGLPAYVRIATRRPQENARLLQAISELPAA